MKALIPVLSAALVVGLAVPAVAAALFTINVPVNVTNISPDAKKIRVSCHISGPNPLKGGSLNFGGANGKSAELTLTNGAYAGTVTLVFATEDFSSQELANLSVVNDVQCTLGIQGPDSVWYQPEGQTTPLLGNKPGAPFKPIVFAPIK